MAAKAKKQKISEKGIPYGSRQKVPAWFNLAWTSRGISAAINVVLLMNLTYYCTDILGLNAGIVGAMFVASKVIDAITDLFAGYIIDHTHTKLGKARPYEIFIVFEWLFTVFLFSTPTLSTTAQYVWIFIFYVLINAICSTMLGAADSVYLSRVFTTQKNQIGAMSFNGAVVMVTTIIFSIIFPQFLAGAGSTKAGWTQFAISLAIPLSVIGILRFVLCKEVKVDSPSKNGTSASLPLKTIFGALSKNKYYFIVLGLMLVSYICNNMTAATTYYFKYIVGNIGLQSVISMTSLATPVILILFPLFAKKLGTTRLLQYSFVLGVVGMIIRTIGGTNIATLIIGSLASGIAITPISLMINTYLIDCMDYGEWKTGIRVEGMIASTANFTGKLGSAIASGLVGAVMAASGYDGTLAVQAASANHAIIFLYNLLPIALYIIMLILSSMYKVDSIRDQMNADLQKRHAQADN